MSDLRLGEPKTYVPVCKHPRDFMFTFGPLGYVLVEEVGECPITVRQERRDERE